MSARAWVTSTASFTRPANTTAYAARDLIANNTTAASVAPLEFANMARGANEHVAIWSARIHKDDADITNANFRLHLFDADPTGTAPTNGDNGAFEVVGITAGEYLGYFDVDMTGEPDIFSDGNSFSGVSHLGAGHPIVARPATTSLYGLLEANAIYTPASGEEFTVTLEGERG